MNILSPLIVRDAGSNLMGRLAVFSRLTGTTAGPLIPPSGTFIIGAAANPTYRPTTLGIIANEHSSTNGMEEQGHWFHAPTLTLGLREYGGITILPNQLSNLLAEWELRGGTANVTCDRTFNAGGTGGVDLNITGLDTYPFQGVTNNLVAYAKSRYRGYALITFIKGNVNVPDAVVTLTQDTTVNMWEVSTANSPYIAYLSTSLYNSTTISNIKITLTFSDASSLVIADQPFAATEGIWRSAPFRFSGKAVRKVEWVFTLTNGAAGAQTPPGNGLRLYEAGIVTTNQVPMFGLAALRAHNTYAEDNIFQKTVSALDLVTTRIPSTPMLATDSTGKIVPATTAGIDQISDYLWSIQTIPAPLATYVRFDSLTVSAVTKLYIADRNLQNVDMTPVLSKIALGDYVAVQHKTDATKTYRFRVRAAVVDQGNYFDIPVEYISSDSAVLPASNDIVTFITSKVGQGAGTVNTVAKWITPTTLGNSTIIDNGSTVSTTLKFIAPNLDGTVGRISKWVTDTNTFGDSLFQDDGVNIGLNQAPNADTALAITRTFPVNGNLQYGILLTMNVAGPSGIGKYGLRSNMTSTHLSGALYSMQAFLDYAAVGGTSGAAIGTLGEITNLNSFISGPRIGDGATVQTRTGFSATSFSPIAGHFGTGRIYNNFGFDCEPLSLGITSNIGFRSQLTQGANRWNFYALGDADNYFAGNLGIKKLTPELELDIVGSSRVTADTYLGTAVWGAASLATDGSGKIIPGVASPVGGSGDDDYVARWMPPTGATLGIGALRDNGTNVSIGQGINAYVTLALSRIPASPTTIEYGILNNLTVDAAATFERRNLHTQTIVTTTGSLFAIFGHYDYPYSAISANITSLYGIFLTGSFGAASVIGTRYGLFVQNPTNATTTIGTHIGVRVAALTGTGPVYGLNSMVAAGTNKYNLYIDGTAQNLLTGITGIGAAPLTDTQLRIYRVPASASAVDIALTISLINSVNTTFERRGIFNSFTFSQPGSSGNGVGYYDYPVITAGTVPDYRAIMISGSYTAGTSLLARYGIVIASPGNAATVIQNSNVGILVQDQHAVAATGYVRGIESAISYTGTYAKHNLYLGGTAHNYIRGNVGIGSGKETPSAQLDVNGLIQGTQAFISSAPLNPGYSVLRMGVAFQSATGLSWINQGLRVNGTFAVHDPLDTVDPNRSAHFVTSANGIDLDFPTAPPIPKVFGSTAVLHLKTDKNKTSTAIVGLSRHSLDNTGGQSFTEKWYKIAFVRGADVSYAAYGSQMHIDFWGGLHGASNKSHYRITIQHRDSMAIVFHSLGVSQNTGAGIRIYENPTTRDLHVYAFIAGSNLYPNFYLNVFVADLLASSVSTTLYPDPDVETDPASASMVKRFDTATSTPTFTTSGYLNVSGTLLGASAKIGADYIAAGTGTATYIPKWSNTTGTLVNSPISDTGSVVNVYGRALAATNSPYIFVKAAAGSSAVFYAEADAGYATSLMFRTGTALPRWLLTKNSAVESGANVGSDLSLIRYADNGTTSYIVFDVNRASGNTTFTEAVTAKNLYISSLTAGAPYVAVEAGTGRLVGTTAPGGSGAVSGTSNKIAKFGPTGATVIDSLFRESGSNSVVDGNFYVQHTTTPAQQGAMNIIVATGQFAQFGMFRGDATNSANKPRWAWIMDNGSESHASAGFSATSAMYFRRYADDGVAYGDIFVVNRSNGKLDFKVTPSVNGVDVSTGGNVSATTGNSQKLLKFTNSAAPFTVADSLLTEGSGLITFQAPTNAIFQLFSNGASTSAALQFGNGNEWRLQRETDAGFAFYRIGNATALWKYNALSNVMDFKYTPTVLGVEVMLSNVATGPGTGSQNNIPKWSGANSLVASTITEGAVANELVFNSPMTRARSTVVGIDQTLAISALPSRKTILEWQSNNGTTGAGSSVMIWALQRELITSNVITGTLRGGGDLVLVSYADNGTVANEVLRFSRNISGLATFKGTVDFTQLVSFTNFTITSTTMIAGLNADRLDDKHWTDFASSSHNHSTLYQPLDADLTEIAGQTGTGYLRRISETDWVTDAAIPWASITGEPAITSATGTAGVIPMFDATTGLASSLLSQSGLSLIYQSTGAASVDIKAAGANTSSLRMGNDSSTNWRFTVETNDAFSFYRQGGGLIWQSVAGTDNIDFKVNPTVNGATNWTSSNDGHGLGLDADTLDGLHASAFALAGGGSASKIVSFTLKDTNASTSEYNIPATAGEQLPSGEPATLVCDFVPTNFRLSFWMINSTITTDQAYYQVQWAVNPNYTSNPDLSGVTWSTAATILSVNNSPEPGLKSATGALSVGGSTSPVMLRIRGVNSSGVSVDVGMRNFVLTVWN